MQKKDWEIIPMARDHIPALAQLERECFADPWSESGIGAELENPLAVFRTAVSASGEVMGYAGMTHVLDEGYIDNIAVGEPFRRKGVAASLLKELISYAREKDMAFLTLEVRRSNLGAQALYRKCGFKEKGIRPGFYVHPAEDAVIMTLEL